MSFVGIGMGAIQAGLFLPRAQEAGLACTVLVRRAEQANGIAGRVVVNVAHHDGIRSLILEDVTALALTSEAALPALIAAEHIAVAVSSVADYAGLAPLLAEAMCAKADGQGPFAVFYASENALDAADQLTAAITGAGGPGSAFVALDTVIGKMSRTLRDAGEIAAMGLQRGTDALPETWLVEAFDDIHVTACERPVLPRLSQHVDLMPYEQAKLNGHNAAHVTLAYAGQILGLPNVSDALAVPDVASLVTGAFVEETGATLCGLYDGLLFTPEGWQAHSDDLFARMANPYLSDDCLRVGRDPLRKLGWNDRLVGTIRMIEATGRDAPRWHMALHLALEAAGLAPDAMARAWTGVPQAEAMAFVARSFAHRTDFDQWRGALRAA